MKRILAANCGSHGMRRSLGGALLLGVLLTGKPCLRAADGVWTQPVTGNLWGISGNWASGAIADGTNFTANFGTIDITSDTSVRLDSARSIGNLIFGDSTIGTAGSWILDNNGSALNVLTLSGATPTITVNALGAGKSATISLVLAGTSGLTKAGLGTLVLSGVNTYTGTTAVTAGILSLTNGSALGGSAAVAMTSGAQLELSGGLTFGTGSTITINGGGVNYAGSLQSASGTNVWAGNVVIGSTQARLGAQSGATLNISGIISGANGIQLSVRNLDQTGTTILSGANTYNAQTIVLGRLSVGTIGSVGSISSNLGAPTTAVNAQINLGLGANTATLIYTGTGETTDRIIRLDASDTSGATLDQSGIGLLKFTSNLSYNAAGGGTRTLTLQGSTAGSGEITGIIANAGASAFTAVAKSGTGTWTLSGANTFTGGLTINAGTIQLGSTGALNSTAGSENEVIFGAGSTGVLSLNGQSVTISNLTSNVTPGTPVLQNANAVSATLTVGNSLGASGTFAGVLQNGTGGGSLGLTKAGAGTLTLTGTNTYTGATTIGAGGVLRLGIGGTTGSISSSSTVINNGALVINRSDPNTFANTITGTGSLEKAGGGDLTLSGVGSTYSGGTTVSGANNFIMGSNGALGNGSLTFTNVATARLSLNGTEQTITGLTVLGAAATVIQNQGGGNGVLTVNLANGVTSSSTSNFYFRDQSGGTGTLGLIKTGAGTLDFSTFNTMSYLGGLTVNEGIFAFNLSAAVGNGSITLGGGTLKVTSGASLAISRATTLATATTSEIDTGAGTVTYSGAITGAGALKKSGTGKLILSSSGSSYGGGTNLSAGTIAFGDVAALGSGAVTFSADSTLEAGVAGTLANAIVISNNVTGTFHTQGYNVIATGTVTGAGSLQKDGTGLLRLSSSGNTYSGGTTIKGGTLSYSDVSALGSGAVTFAASATLESDTAGTLANAIVVGSGLTATVDTKANEVTFSGNITGAGGILKKGFGILYLSGTNNSFSGGLTIENASSGIVGPTAYGVVLLANNAAGTGPLTIGNANTSIARFSLNGYDQTVSELSSGSVGIRVLEANGVTGGAISTLTVNQSTNTTYTGFLRDQNTGGGKLALVKTGSGLLDLSGAQTASTYSGGLTVNSGILGFANEQNVGSGTITMGGGTLRYTPTGTTALTIPNASIVLSASTGSTIEVTNAGGTLTASGILSGAGDLAKTGAGTLILSNANTYTGDITVSEGTLRINGNQSSATGAIAISSGATLGGTGTLGTTSITGAGQLTAGLAGDTGTIHFAGNLSTTGVTWLVDLVHQTSVDFVNVSSGSLNISGSKLLLSTSGTFSSSDPTAYRIAQFGTGGGQGLTGMFQDAFSATISEGAIINGQYRISYGQELGGYITLTAVPEPFTIGFLGFLFGGAFGFRRYRRLFRAVKEAG